MRGKNDRCKQKTSKETDGLQEKKDGRLEEPVAVEEERRGGVGTISVAETKELPNGVSVEGEGKGETWASGLCDERNDGPIYLRGGGVEKSRALFDVFTLRFLQDK